MIWLSLFCILSLIISRLCWENVHAGTLTWKFQSFDTNTNSWTSNNNLSVYQHSHIHIVHSFTDPFKPLCGFILWYDHGHMTTTMVWECEHSLASAVLEWMVTTPWPTSVCIYSHTSRPRSYQTNSLIMEQEVTFSSDCPLCAIQTSTNCNGKAHCTNSDL